MCLTVFDEDELGLKYDRSSDGEYKRWFGESGNA
jgi:hypothetical protein